MELLAPAGNMTTALAAFDAGADAVYCGLKKFNARERGDNFSPEDMSKLIAYSRKIGKKVYITFNTLVKESELDLAADELARLDMLRPDAVIVQDIGIVRMIREFFPHLVIHGSTQMALHDSAAVETARKMGIRRVILERQITMDELEILVKNSPLELEVFAHGALCACLSGTCLFSSWLGGCSGNRGKCKQPCRRMFRSDRGTEGFFLSTRDLAAIELIPKFRELGIASIKIEGRLRKADYVEQVVSAYRTALDTGDPAEALRMIDRTCSRERSLGFYSRDSMKHLIRSEVPGGVGLFCGRVTRVFPDSFEAKLTGRLHIGDTIRIQSASGDEGDALTVLDLSIGSSPVLKAFSGDLCRIASRGKKIPSGGIIYRIGHTRDGMEKRIASLPLQKPLIDLDVSLSSSGIYVKTYGREFSVPLELREAERHSATEAMIRDAFRSSADSKFAPGEIKVTLEKQNLFLPAAVLKSMRRSFWKWADDTLNVDSVCAESASRAEAVKAFRRDMAYHGFPAGRRIIFAGRDPVQNQDAVIARDISVPPAPDEECILPVFTPEDRIPELKRKIGELIAQGVHVFRAASLSHFSLIPKQAGIEIKTAPPLPLTNSFAVLEIKSLGASCAMAHIELALEDIEALRKKSVLPLEQYVSGYPVLLATRAGIADIKSIRDIRGETFLLRRADGLVFLHPAVPMKTALLPDMIPVEDHRLRDPEGQGSPFNSERGLA